MNNNNNPIGMIDSGLGGLSLFKHIREALPNED
ncbi:glutamate racemase, partial [Acinetobacter baumannii]|nr:glutamate racemase [Acinetobacter baumannii]